MCLAVILGTLSHTASAAPITFFGEDVNANGSLPVPNSSAAQSRFLSNLNGVRVETFEGIATGTKFPISISFGPDVATLMGTNTVANTGVQGQPIAGRFAISGTHYLNVGSTDAASFTLSFSSPQAAFGFFATDIGDNAGRLTLSFDGGTPFVVPHTINPPSGSAFFFGIINTDMPFSRVTFSNTTGSFIDAFGFDDLTIGRTSQVSGVPEPASMTLLVLGSCMVVGTVHHRRNTAR